MLASELETQIENETTALYRLMYADGVGLSADTRQMEAHSRALARLYAEVLHSPNGASDFGGPAPWSARVKPGLHHFALESWVESRRVALDNRLSEALDRRLKVPSLQSSAGGLTWRNWRQFEREAAAAGDDRLREGFYRLVELSAEATPLLEQRLAQIRADYGEYGLTPVHIYAWRERLAPDFLHGFLQRVGRACRAAFQPVLADMSQAVFGRPAGPAELRALFINCMYERTSPLFSTESAVADTLRAFHDIGFDLSRVSVDVEDRPRKQSGAFCFPVSTPSDVRVSVRTASAHHLVDMLYHEFGHAAHFSGIRADLSFVDREWIRSGTHETFATLFEHLLGEPAFLRDRFGFDDGALDQLLKFDRFKWLLTATWYSAAALAVVEAWREQLSWTEFEARYAAHVSDFTGVPMPGGFARLESSPSALILYPAGYVIAAVRVSHWVNHLRSLGGEAWWYSADAQADIRARIEAGGTVKFPDEWNDPAEFLQKYCEPA